MEGLLLPGPFFEDIQPLSTLDFLAKASADACMRNVILLELYSEVQVAGASI